jgi:hypothetical protein
MADIIRELREELNVTEERFSDTKKRYGGERKDKQGHTLLLIVLLFVAVFLGVYLFQKNYHSPSKDEGDDPLFQSF